MRALRALPLVLLLAGEVRAHGDEYTRFAGGGPRRTDCMLVTDVSGVTGARRARAVRCTDGDLACDGDGRPDGACRFLVRVCVQDDTPDPRCHQDTVMTAAVTSTEPELAAVAAALAAVPMPTPADTCSVEAGVVVATRGRRPGRLALRSEATMASGHADRDRVTLVCRPAPAAATFATIEQRIFAMRCTAPSCHGAAGAGGLMLTPGAAYGALVAVPATNPAARAAGLLRVLPDAPDRSFLVRKLEGALGPDEGDRMPMGSTLPARDLALIRRWIEAGAPADAPF
jgi:hypothetical protein